MATLDIAEPQILYFFEDDPNLQWHHRILLRRLSGAEWVVATPDGDIESLDLQGARILALPRAAPVPRQVRGNVYLFGAVTEVLLAQYHGAAQRMAQVLGAGAPAPADAVAGPAEWRVADPGEKDFGEVVPNDVVTNVVLAHTQDSVGIAKVGTPPRWVHIQRVADGDVNLWTDEKHGGAGRDRRLAGPRQRGKKGQLKLTTLQDATDSFRPLDLSKWEDWPHDGPRAVMEIIMSILRLGLTLFTYHDHWVRLAGVHADSAVSWEHRMLLTILGFMVNYDRIDPTNLAAAELLGRRVVMIERAVRVNPKAPAFAGLHKMIEHSLDEGGGLATREFTSHMAQVAESEARVLKQNRLLREELDSKRKSDQKGDGSGDGNNNNKNKKDKNKKTKEGEEG